MLARGDGRVVRRGGRTCDAAILNLRQGTCHSAWKLRLKARLRTLPTPTCRSSMINRISKWAPTAALILAMGLTLLCSTPSVLAKDQSAKKLYKAGQAAEARSD